MNVQERFLYYVSFDTQSDEHSQITPSPLKQLELAGAPVGEMKAIGIEDAYVDEFGIVYSAIPATTKKDVKSIGLIVHMDTSLDTGGRDAEPKIVKSYDGSDIALNEELGTKMGVYDFTRLQEKVGEDLIVTDGTTLLGADDKAGVAEIMTMAETLLQGSREHGEICLASTPDEEVGRGADHFRTPEFGADIAYTVDGGEVDCADYENFNAVNVEIQIRGLSTYPGGAKDKMINAPLVVMGFHSMLPVQKNLAYTEGYESFHHLTDLHGECEHAYMSYIIRNHSEKLFGQQKAEFQRIAGYPDQRYPKNTIQLQIRDSYANMCTITEKGMRIVELVEAPMKQIGSEPRSMAIRGGADGTHLTYDGLPCPGLGTGGYNYHGKYELASIQEMQKSVELLLETIENNVQET